MLSIGVLFFALITFSSFVWRPGGNHVGYSTGPKVLNWLDPRGKPSLDTIFTNFQWLYYKGLQS
jgi:hypothetical protein